MPAESAPTIRQTGAPRDFAPGTLVDVFRDGLRNHPEKPAMTVRYPDGSWHASTRLDVSERVRCLALGLRSLGYERGDRVGILAHTRMEWALADWACIMSGLVVVTVYPTLPPDQVLYILRDSGVRALFAADQKQLDKLVEIKGELPHLERVISFEPVDARGLPVLSLGELEDAGKEADEPPGDSESFARKAAPDDVATLIYTSGTTGEPKGVMLTHHNLYTNTIASAECLPISARDNVLSWLPLSHAFERTAGHYVMWHCGVEVAYAESSSTVARDMLETKPTVMIGVPRMYEKFYDAVVEAVAAGGAVKKLGFKAAKRIGDLHAARRLNGKSIPLPLRAAYGVADRIVFSKLRERTGGRVRYFVSGAAPLSPEIARFFYSGGLVVLEGYGLSETSPVTNVNPPHDIRFGTVGPPIPGTEIRIAEDGEILIRGPQVMKGYFGRPEDTRRVLSEDGWLRTGDIGELDGDGYLKITDRKKNLIVTAAGKNVAPQPIEERIARSPFVEQVVLLGDRRKFPLALIVPSFQAFKIALPGRAVTEADRKRYIDHPALRDLVEGDVFPRVADFARYERPKRTLLVADPFTVDNGQLTPTLKAKRRVIAGLYAQRVEQVYREAEQEMEDGGE